MKDFDWGFAALLALLAVAIVLEMTVPRIKNKPIPPLTPQDALLAVEALEARQNAKNEAIWEAIRLYHPDNDEHAEKFAKTLKEAGIPNLPGVR